MASISSASASPARAFPRIVLRHSALVRVCHWVNALCFFFLLMSGLQIFNARPGLSWGQATDFNHPFLSFSARENDDGDPIAGVTTIFGHAFDTTGVFGASRGSDGELEERGFPSWATLPAEQDLAMGRRWHFFFAWILVLNGLVYVVNLFARRHIRDLVPSAQRPPFDPARHRRSRAAAAFPRAKRRCTTTCCRSSPISASSSPLPILVLAGLTMSPGLDAALPWLLTLFGGRQSARTIHFILATYLVLFVLVHLVMVLVSGLVNNMRSMITGRYRIRGGSAMSARHLSLSRRVDPRAAWRRRRPAAARRLRPAIRATPP